MIDFSKTPYFEITRSNRHVIGYGMVSGFGYGLWVTRSLEGTIFFVVVGLVMSMFNIAVSKTPNAPFFIKSPYYVENLIRLAIIAVPSYFMVKGLLAKEWVLVMLLTWCFFLPLVYLFWRDWSPMTDDINLSDVATIGFNAKVINFWAKFLCVFFVFLILFGAAFAVYRWNYLRSAITTEATITNMIERKDDNGDSMYAPEYVFTDQHGKSYEITSSIASNPPISKVGDHIEVLYDPANPKNSIENYFLSKWGIPIGLCGFGVIMFILSGAVVFFTGRHLKKKDEQGGNLISNSNSRMGM